jgi:hypothetical protein
MHRAAVLEPHEALGRGHEHDMQWHESYYSLCQHLSTRNAADMPI